MNNKSFYRIAATLFMSSLLFLSCDKDFSEIGSGIVDDDHFAFLPDTVSTVKAYSQATGVLQSNNLPLNPLGIYKNPVFGTVKANFVTQLELKTLNPVFDVAKNPILDSVVLTIPYFSTSKRGVDNVLEYELDSIKGSGTIDLKVFESGFVLNELDPSDNFQTQQRYYTNQDADIDGYKKGTMLNNSTNTKENTAFEQDNKTYVTLKLDRGLNVIDPPVVASTETPRMRLHLDKAFFQQKIMNAPSGKLLNNSVFKEYFRGIYFQVGDATDGTLMQLDFTKGNITLHYHEYTSLDENGAPDLYKDSEKDTYGGTPKLSAKTLMLEMKGQTVSLLKTENDPLYTNALAAVNPLTGDSRLYLKGGEGSVAIIDLFGPDNFGDDGLTGIPDGVADELNIIRNNGWLINEANLTFYIDRDAMGNAPDPQRVYLYDLTNRRPLIDWSADQSGSSANPKFIKSIHDGIIQRDADEKGTKYRVRITNHVRNLIRKDSTNVKLGLSVTESVALTTNMKLKAPVTIPGSEFLFDRVPAASLINPLGTILYGTNIAPESKDYKKRLKLEIYYTKPN